MELVSWDDLIWGLIGLGKVISVMMVVVLSGFGPEINPIKEASSMRARIQIKSKLWFDGQEMDTVLGTSRFIPIAVDPLTKGVLGLVGSGVGGIVDAGIVDLGLTEADWSRGLAGGGVCTRMTLHLLEFLSVSCNGLIRLRDFDVAIKV